mgnify:FL=1|tara:strand:+ start:141 stop:764 length:624 start_codon:yes stop_codon:yes gene_type:complete
MRVAVYVDGFNVYYRALQRSRFKWLDLEALATRLLKPSDSVDLVRYFTARVKPRPGFADAPRKQQIYLNALKSSKVMRIHFGSFLSKSVRRPLAADPNQFVEVLDTEEKGSDVNLASYLLHDGWNKRYDLALVLSQDTDLVEPIRLVTNDLKLPVGVIWVSNTSPNPKLVSVASFVRHASKSDLKAAQFADPLPLLNGKFLNKPAGW